MHRPQRYTWSAPLYDLIPAEPIYGIGRRAGVGQLHLTQGDRVLDVGCGTGLNLPLLRRAVGPSGAVVGTDASAAMLQQADRRVRRHGWSNVELVTADATTVPARRLRRAAGPSGRPGAHVLADSLCDDHEATLAFDAVIATYALSLMPQWPAAWQTALDAMPPGGRVVVVDMAKPVGLAGAFAPLARLACALGGADVDTHPWTLMNGLDDVQSRVFRGGHVQVWSGTAGSSSAPGSELSAHASVSTIEGRGAS